MKFHPHASAFKATYGLTLVEGTVEPFYKTEGRFTLVSHRSSDVGWRAVPLVHL